jgi:hypothetical protein
MWKRIRCTERMASPFSLSPFVAQHCVLGSLRASTLAAALGRAGSRRTDFIRVAAIWRTSTLLDAMRMWETVALECNSRSSERLRLL